MATPPPGDMDAQRATQGFVANLASLRARPMLTLIEVAWRWLFGIPALALIYREGARVLNTVPWRATGVQNSSINELLTDPMRAATRFADLAAVVGPGLYHAAVWLVPSLLLLWVVASGVGRAALLRRMDPDLHFRPLTLMLLQALRMLPLGAAFAIWWIGLRALANGTIYRPIASGTDPNIMLYVGGVIAMSLGLFVVAAGTGWIFSMAPLLSAAHATGALRSLRDALRVGKLRSGLIEINMVMGVVKIALLVLAMVFSACPLPFQSVMTDEFLFWWNVAVAIWYFLASDFFHVARLSGYLRLWQAARQ